MGPRQDPDWVESYRPHELCDTLERQATELDAHDIPDRDVADDAAQGMVSVDLAVAVGQQQHARGAGDPAADIADRIQSRLVGPVGVLQDEYRGSGRIRQQPQHRLQHTRAVRSIEGIEECRYVPRDIPEGVEGARDAQVVAGTEVDRATCRVLRPECTHERALADAGLPTDQHYLAARDGRRGGHITQPPQLCVALEQHALHDTPSVLPAVRLVG